MIHIYPCEWSNSPPPISHTKISKGHKKGVHNKDKIKKSWSVSINKNQIYLWSPYDMYVHYTHIHTYIFIYDDPWQIIIALEGSRRTNTFWIH